jgi:hypothetical protein
METGTKMRVGKCFKIEETACAEEKPRKHIDYLEN